MSLVKRLTKTKTKTKDDIQADIVTALKVIDQATTNQLLTQQQMATLVRCAGQQANSPLNPNLTSPISDPGYGPGFDLTGEFNNQIRIVRALQDKIQNPDGSLKEKISPREAKELITAGGTVLTALLKNHKELLSLDRRRALEAATIDTISELPPATKEAFFSNLEERLSHIS